MSQHGHLSDTELLRRSMHEPAAFEVLFERHAPRLQGWLARQTGDVGVANDLTAETFAQAWRSRRRFSGDDPTAGAAWLYGIARNLVRQHYKHGRVETAGRRRLGMSLESPHDDDYDAVIERLDAEGDATLLEAALAEVSEQQRRAIRSRIMGGRGYDEIARQLGCTAENARAHVSRGLRSLNLIMKGQQQ
jgi:RNA polymerase sigma-70 factor (ECF subfamily)